MICLITYKPIRKKIFYYFDLFLWCLSSIDQLAVMHDKYQFFVSYD